MGYKIQDNDGRTPGEPYPDYERNYEYLIDLFLKPRVMAFLFNNEVDVTWRGINKIGYDKNGKATYDVYTHVEIAWTKNDKRYVDRISVHTPLQEVVKESERRFKGVL